MTQRELPTEESMTHFKLEVMILCQGVSKILTANRISPIIFPFYHLKEEIRSFPTMYNTLGGSWGQFGETNHFLPKIGQKTLFLAVMVPDHLTSEWAGTHNRKIWNISFEMSYVEGANLQNCPIGGHLKFFSVWS